eukprot:UN08495
MKKLAKLKQQGINMTLEELEQMIQQGKLADINKQVHNGQFYEHSDEDNDDDAEVSDDDDGERKRIYSNQFKKDNLQWVMVMMIQMQNMVMMKMIVIV